MEERKEGGEEGGRGGRKEDGGKMEERMERMREGVLPVSAESVFLSHPAGCAEADW